MQKNCAFKQMAAASAGGGNNNNLLKFHYTTRRQKEHINVTSFVITPKQGTG
jgi:hypothetical protein